MSKEYKDYLKLFHEVYGKERQIEIYTKPMEKTAFIPHSVLYEDIDNEFKQWVESLRLTSDDGKEFPTMTLFSNQRFSEYTQSWKYTDVNKNLLLNFKTITRENNPQFGKIQNGYWNIPQTDKFFTLRKQIVLDDNGTESYLVVKMRQPLAVDISYKLTVFTTQFHSINDFNVIVNEAFRARQCYIAPFGHYMPMVLEGISDQSSYNIDDRQFYGQTYSIKLMGYILREEDFKVEEIPLKRFFSIPMLNMKKNIPEIEIEECEEDDNITLTIALPSDCNNTNAVFTMDCNATFTSIKIDNLYKNYKFYINGELVTDLKSIIMKENDKIKIKLSKQLKTAEAKMILTGKKT